MRSKVLVLTAVPLLALTACSSSEKSSSPSSAGSTSASSSPSSTSSAASSSTTSSAAAPSSSSAPVAASSAATAASPTSGADNSVPAASADYVFNKLIGQYTGPSVRKDLAKARRNAHTVCADLRGGTKLMPEASKVGSWYPDLSQRSQGEFIGAAIGSYCKDQLSKIQP